LSSVRERQAHLIGVPLEQGRPVTWAGAGEHHVVDRVWQVLEESLQRGRIGGVEGGRAPGVDVARCPLEALGIAAREDDLSALATGASSGLEPDSCAPADHDDGLPEEFVAWVGGAVGSVVMTPPIDGVDDGSR
jgi:hypothetical protein